ncbi:hypothetical protein TWF281_004616 [Arthrobotrys megalospora]
MAWCVEAFAILNSASVSAVPTEISHNFPTAYDSLDPQSELFPHGLPSQSTNNILGAMAGPQVNWPPQEHDREAFNEAPRYFQVKHGINPTQLVASSYNISPNQMDLSAGTDCDPFL